MEEKLFREMLSKQKEHFRNLQLSKLQELQELQKQEEQKAEEELKDKEEISNKKVKKK